MRTTICILLSTFNGENYLQPQLESIFNQENITYKLIVRDDGSVDNTDRILNDYQARGLLTWYKGSNIGPALSFMDLLYHAPEYDFYAFCDQDDIWLPNKLNAAITRLLNESCGDSPALYISDTILVDKNLRRIKQKKDRHLFTFEASLLRNPATGCTMVINNRLKTLICGFRPSFVSMHDSWAYRVCLACGGSVIYDNESYILYRQHGENVLGGKKHFIRRWKNRIKRLFVREFKGERLKTAENLLNGYRAYLNENNYKTLHILTHYQESLKNKMWLCWNKNMKTATLSGKLMFIVSILTNKY